MPFTPYHFGPSGFVGLLLRRWVDVPVFVAANVLIDVEVLADQHFAPGWPVHQVWHFHTLLIGGLAGAIFGALIYTITPLRWCSEKSMSLIGLGGRATLRSMILAGLAGACFHVFIDSFYHYDVQIFWPHEENTIFKWLSGRRPGSWRDIQQNVRLWCQIGWGLMAGLYVLLLTWKLKTKRPVENE